MCGLIVTIVGLGLYTYYVRELMVAITLFSVLLHSGFGSTKCASNLVCQRAGGNLGQSRVAEFRGVFPPFDCGLRKAVRRKDTPRQNWQLCTNEQTREFASTRIIVGRV